MHANSAADVPARLEALGALAGLGRDALHAQLASAIRVLVHLTRGADGRRRLAEISLLAADASGYCRTVPALTFTEDGIDEGRGAPELLGMVRP